MMVSISHMMSIFTAMTRILMYLNSAVFLNYIFTIVLLAVIIIVIVLNRSYHRHRSQYNSLLNDFKQKNLLYSRLLENVNQMIFIVDENHQIIDVNNYACKILNYSKRELRDKNYENIIPHEYWHQLNPRYVVDEMLEKSVNRHLITRNKELVPVKVYTIKQTYDHLTLFIEFYTDRFELDRANLISRFIDKKYKAVFDLSLNAIVVTNQQDKIVECNSSFEQITGYTKSELVKKKIDDILECPPHDDILNADDDEEVNKVYSQFSSNILSNCRLIATDNKKINAYFNRATIEFGQEKRLFYFINKMATNNKIEQEISILKNDLQRFYSKSNDLIIILDTNQNILDINTRALQLLNYTKKELLYKKITDIVDNRYRDYWMNIYNNLHARKWSQNVSFIFRSKDKRNVHVEGSFYLKNDSEENTQVYCVFNDVSEILHTIEALKDSQKRYLDLYENAPDMYFTIDVDGIIMLANKMGAKYLGYTKDELMGRPVWDIIHDDDIASVKRQILEILSGKLEKSHMEFRKIRKDGSIIYVDEIVRLIMDEDGNPKELRISCTDNTQQVITIKALKESEEKYRKLIEESNDAIYLLYNDRFEFINKKFEQILGYSQEEVRRPDFNIMELVAPNSEMLIKERRNGLMDAQDTGDRYEFTAITKIGELIDVEVSVYHIDYNGGVATQGILRNITERKKMEKELKKSEAYFRTVFDGARDAILVESIDGHIYDVNEAACRMLGYSRSEFSRLSVMDLLPSTMMERIPEIKIAHKSGHNFFIAEGENIHKNGHIIPVEVSTSTVEIDNKPRIIAVVRDITDRKIAEKEKLEGIRLTVSALAKAIELRDPYTSGHSSKVANIAETIARELKWDDDRILGIRLAAELHDIGKIAIPAEILGKPGKLTDLEYTIVQEHVQKGYEILKDIQFPFPVAEAVYQHHELLDGSGYPRKLKGNEIIEEARIIGVADILETFTSHRPYRPALGLDQAMEMLTRESNILYDGNIIQLVKYLITKNKGKPFW